MLPKSSGVSELEVVSFELPLTQFLKRSPSIMIAIAIRITLAILNGSRDLVLAAFSGESVNEYLLYF